MGLGVGLGGNKGHVLPSPTYFAPLQSGPAQSRGLCFQNMTKILLISWLCQSEHHSVEMFTVAERRGEERKWNSLILWWRVERQTCQLSNALHLLQLFLYRPFHNEVTVTVISADLMSLMFKQPENLGL